MSEARSPEQQPAARASDNEISDESLEAVSGGLSLYGNTPGGRLVPPTLPVIKPVFEPSQADPTILIVEE
jgi:hypothetical protein